MKISDKSADAQKPGQEARNTASHARVSTKLEECSQDALNSLLSDYSDPFARRSAKRRLLTQALNEGLMAMNSHREAGQLGFVFRFECVNGCGFRVQEAQDQADAQGQIIDALLESVSKMEL